MCMPPPLHSHYIVKRKKMMMSLTDINSLALDPSKCLSVMKFGDYGVVRRLYLKPRPQLPFTFDPVTP